MYSGEDNYPSLPGVDVAHSGKELSFRSVSRRCTRLTTSVVSLNFRSHWALWARAMLLWFACVRHASRGRPHIPLSGFRSSPSQPHEDATGRDDADFAMRAWMETVAIEDALNAHTCNTEQSMMYQVCARSSCVSKKADRKR